MHYNTPIGGLNLLIDKTYLREFNFVCKCVAKAPNKQETINGKFTETQTTNNPFILFQRVNRYFKTVTSIKLYPIVRSIACFVNMHYFKLIEIKAKLIAFKKL